MIEVNLAVDMEGLEDILESAAQAALDWNKATGDMTISVVDDEEIHRLNLEFRGVDRPTDVLTFPSDEGEEIAAPPGFLGDVIVSLPRARAQAVEYGHSLRRELSFLAIHGTLHLLGYDHMEQEEAGKMFGMQDEILEQMGIRR